MRNKSDVCKGYKEETDVLLPETIAQNVRCQHKEVVLDPDQMNVLIILANCFGKALVNDAMGASAFLEI